MSSIIPWNPKKLPIKLGRYGPTRMAGHLSIQRMENKLTIKLGNVIQKIHPSHIKLAPKEARFFG